MPIANLTATAEGFRTQWALGAGASKVAAVNSDDWPITFINETTALDRQTFVWTDLPLDARGGTILQYEAETTDRRAGGALGATWNVMIRDNTTTNEVFGTVHPSDAAAPATRRFSVFATDPNGVPWTQPQVDAVEAGVRYIGGGSGVNVFYMILNITYTGPSGSQDILGCSWLLPLIGAGLRGLNLFHESKEWWRIFDYAIYRKIMRQNKISVYPALMLKEEREWMLKELFTQRAYAF